MGLKISLMLHVVATDNAIWILQSEYIVTISDQCDTCPSPLSHIDRDQSVLQLDMILLLWYKVAISLSSGPLAPVPCAYSRPE
jgi:hypothetical protein